MNIGVLASTNGTDLQAIIDEVEAGRLCAKICVVISNKKNAYALQRAKNHRIETVFVSPKGKKRKEYDREVAEVLKKHSVDLVLLIGYMRILSPNFVKMYENRIMNVHPSLLPVFPGMDREVHREVLEHGVKITGCTIHFVDEGTDTGPIILQVPVPILENDNIETLRDRVQKAEKIAFPKAIKLFMEGKLKVSGRRVEIKDFDNTKFVMEVLDEL